MNFIKKLKNIKKDSQSNSFIIYMIIEKVNINIL